MVTGLCTDWRRRIHLVKILLQAFLALKARQVAHCELVFCNAVLRDHILAHLSVVLPLVFHLRWSKVQKQAGVTS